MQSLSFLKAWQKRFSIRNTVFFWYRHYKVFLFVVFLIVLGFGGWVWYDSLYGYSWNEQEKKDFIDSYVKETKFKETGFNDVIKRMKERASEHETNPQVKRNIFTGEIIP